MNQLLPCCVVILLSAFGLGVCTVEPYFIDRTIFCQDFEKLVHEIFIIVVQFEFKLGLVGKWSSGYFPRDGPFGIFAQVSVKSFRIFDLKQVSW